MDSGYFYVPYLLTETPYVFDPDYKLEFIEVKMPEPIPEQWVIDEQIRVLAYLKWERAGCPGDMSNHFWLEAEHEVWCQYGNQEETKDQ